jgi:Zn-dependent membrane protease YugP
MRVLLPALLIVALVFGPGLWVRATMSRYSKPDDRYSGTGAELARHLLDTRGLNDVGVEATEQGDHYDPTSRTVRLSPANHGTGSLTAIAVAAHEVGHAVQHQQAYRPLQWRTRLVQVVGPGQKFAAVLLMASPFVSAFTRVPVTGLLTFAAGFLVMGLGVLVHLITLPTEVDASFGRALPMLREQNILIDGDEPHVRRLLKAAAATYAAASLMSLLNIARWFALLRR